jgi:UPF0755 protein
MNDILPPKRPLNRPTGAPSRPPQQPQARPVGQTPVLPPRPSGTPVTPLQPKPPVVIASKPHTVRKVILWIVAGLVACVIAAAGAAWIWYNQALQPLNPAAQEKIRVTVAPGSAPADIGQLLEEKKLIRSKYAFDIYTRLSDTRNKLQAGTYNLSPSESLEAIVTHLVAGRVDELKLTFLPGATVADNKKVLQEAGYSSEEVEKAFSKTYDHPLFADKPEGTDLEGYIYGETYNFSGDASVEDILKVTFDHYYDVIQEDALVDGFSKQGLNLYQGITLASIIQREVPSATDQKQVAQVFLSRLSIDMMLGSDVTYQYAAKKLGVAPTPTLDSPYNTRKYAGLPPGPIATPGRSALQAVAHPATGDYLFFLSGDDDVTYFGRTSEEHDANIRNHCQKKCAVL